MANCALRLFQLLFNCFCSTGRWVGRAATFQQPIRHQVGYSKFLPTKQTRNDQTLLALDARNKYQKILWFNQSPTKNNSIDTCAGLIKQLKQPDSASFLQPFWIVQIGAGPPRLQETQRRTKGNLQDTIKIPLKIVWVIPANWNSSGMSIPTFYLAFYLTYTLTFYLAFYLTYTLTFYLAFDLTYTLTFYMAFDLTYILAFYLAFILTFYLHSIWHIYSDILTSILSDTSSDIASGILCDIFPSELMSSSAHWDLAIAVEVGQCQLTSGSRSSGPAVPTEIWLSQLRSGSAS